jgi:predicted nucleotidyltransferase
MVIDQQTINQAARLLLEAAPGSTVILFGSRARGDARPDSDVDFLVVEPRVTNWAQETIRLIDVLRPLLVPADVVVFSRERFEYWKETPNTLPYIALKEGRPYEQVA